ncbi:dTDP-glucose 4,6-dehydratase [Psychrobacillus sp. NPDC096389]|uniref:dTDP-glucose 4,6-dehydratase n=1 Tax=Psychrobacillus sp. NPDC096389 TaxID=3364490 RepID=UPI00380B5F49
MIWILLITGGAGFIASNFIINILKGHEKLEVINLDKLTYAGDTRNLEELSNHPNYRFIQGDICDRALLETLFEEYQIDGVIHFAAESHVDNSIENPAAFVETNVLGTMNILDVARNYWMVGPNEYKEQFKNARFHHISTDEVYGSLGENGLFSEDTPYAPNSPYSASKASSDMLVRSYYHTYGMNVVTTNCSNNFGPKQHSEKLIPTIIRKALALESIPIYGDGRNIRDWLFVLDHCQAVEKVYFEGKAGETYLIGGHNERTNIEIAQMICEILDEIKPLKNGVSYRNLIALVEDRPGHDFRYAIDDRKYRESFNDLLKSDFKENLLRTVKYYIEKQ